MKNATTGLACHAEALVAKAGAGGAMIEKQDMMTNWKNGILKIAGTLLLTVLPVVAGQVELRLVVHNEPVTTVDKRDHSRPITNPVSTEKGVVIQQIGVDVSCWARNILLDETPIFERYHKGKYVDRLPVARRDLQPGEHTIWPGNHKFTVARDGTVNTTDPELIVKKNVVSIKCYPVTIRAYRANPPEGDLPMSMRLAPLPKMTLRESADHALFNPPGGMKKERKKKRPTKRRAPYELLPVFEDFAPLTIWLPANTAGKGYMLHPMGLTFHVTAKGVVPGAGDGATIEGVAVKGHQVSIPLYEYPVNGVKGTRMIADDVQERNFSKIRSKQATLHTTWYPKTTPYRLRVSEFGPTLKIEGALKSYPYKSMRMDVRDPTRRLVRLLVAELSSRHLTVGQGVEVRVRGLDPEAAVLLQNRVKAAERKVRAAAQAKRQKKEGAADQLKNAQAALAKAQVDVETGSKENLLAVAECFAELRLYGTSTWKSVPLKKTADSIYTLTPPDLADGAYSLRLGLRPKGMKPISTEQWVTVARERRYSAGVFTPRGRTAFRRGEAFWMGIGLLAVKDTIPAGTPVILEFVDSRGTPLTMASAKTSKAVKTRDTIIVRFAPKASVLLAAGSYTARAKVGNYRTRGIPIHIVEPEPETNFINMMNGKYSAQGSIYRNMLKSGGHLEELAEDLKKSGYNAFMGMTYDMQRVTKPNLDLEQLIRERPALGPWESYFQPSHRDRFLDRLVYHRIRFWEDMITYNDTMHPRNTQILNATQRYCTMETQSMQHSPAFEGICMYDEVYNQAQQGIPEALYKSFAEWQEMTYRERHPGLTSDRALKALDRFVNLPEGQRRYKDLQTYRTYPKYEDWLWDNFAALGSRGARRAMPNSRNFIMHRFFGGNGGNIFPGGNPVGVHKTYEIATCVMYKDGGSGDRPVFAPMQADVLRVNDDITVTTQLHAFHGPGVFGKHIVRQAFFALSQKTDGFTYFTLPHSPISPNPNDWRDTISDLTKRLTTPYGNLFLASDRGYKKVAVYASRTTDYLASQKPLVPHTACEGLWVACVRAGYPADFLYDEHVLAGRAKDYDVIFFPGVHFRSELPPELLKQLKAFVNAGKLLIVEKGSKLPIEGIVHADSTFDEYDSKSKAFPRYIDFESEYVWDQSNGLTQTVKEVLGKHRIAPAAQHNVLVGPDWLRCRQAQYLLMPNFKFTKWRGLYKTQYQAPNKPKLRFPKRPPVCYDVLAMKRHPVKIDGDWMETEVDMRYVPGAFLAFLPAAIDGVRLQVSPAVDLGQPLQYRMAVVDQAGETIDAGIPFEISLLSPGGEVVHRIYRAGTPEYAGAYLMPRNAMAGDWTLRVRELFNGQVAEATIQMAAAGTRRRPNPPAKVDASTVWMRRLDGIKQFLQSKEEILVIVDRDQDWLGDGASALAKALTASGANARVVPLDEALRLPKPWNRMNPQIDGSRLWRGTLVQPGLFIDAPAIVIGRRNDHRLVEALQRRDLLPEPVSENFPAPGKAVVRWIPNAFSNQFDTVCILSNDRAGVTAAIKALGNIDQQQETVFPRADGATAAFNAKAQLELAERGEPVPTAYRDIVGWEEAVTALAFDPARNRVLCGTSGYGDNLFCFGDDGNLLWKQYLPEFNVYYARWIDGGKKVVAATGRGYLFFMLDGATGKVLKKFAATEYPRFHGHWTGAGGEGAVDTKVRIVVNAGQRQILIGGLTGLMAIDFDGRKMWCHDIAEANARVPQEVESSGGAGSYQHSVSMGSFVVSPDGKRIALSQFEKVGSTVINTETKDVWAHYPHIFDAATGKILLRNTEDPGNQTRASGWTLLWPDGRELPIVRTGALEAPMLAGGKLGRFEHRPGQPLANGDRLQLSTTGAVRLRPDGTEVWSYAEGYQWLLWYDLVNVDETRLFRCNRVGKVQCLDLKSGKRLWEYKLPFAARLLPVGDGLIAGCNNGLVVRFNAAGKPQRKLLLRTFHEVVGKGYPKFVQAGLQRDRDSSAEFFPVAVDGPDDFDGVLRLGLEQVVNGGFENEGNWAPADGKPALGPPARKGKRALQLKSGQLVSQEIKRRVIPSATYLLEFYYRFDDAGTRLTAGALLRNGTDENLTASQFRARPGEWTFGRLAVKSYAGTDGLLVGFEADGGSVSVDNVSLRPIRFPSANLLANEELHVVEPTFVKDFRVSYDRIPGDLQKKLMQQSHVTAFKQGGTTSSQTMYQEQAFLHNGRLDDVGPRWTFLPDPIGFSAVLTRPSYISHIVLYLNNATPANTYRFIGIQVNNMETKQVELAALVRGNHRRFVVVELKPAVRTDQVKILPAMHRGHQDCITEIELYGPLGGPDIAGKGKQFPDDPAALPMFMGHPTHVQPRLPEDLLGEYKELPRIRFYGHPPYFSGSLAASGGFTATNPAGAVHELRIPQPSQQNKKSKRRQRNDRLQHGRTWKIGSISPTTTPARYGNRLLVGTADGKMHAVADNGTYLWNFPTAGRVYSSPVPDGDDVYFGSDDGNLYKIDIDSGILIWEFKTGGKVRGAPALAGRTIYVPSWDGSLYAVNADTAELQWKRPIAKYTRCSPAVADGKVYLGDEGGNARCFDARNGKEIWTKKLNGHISRCPVVTPKGVLFISDQGEAVWTGHDGRVLWKQQLGRRISGQPLPTKSQLCIPHEGGLAVLRQSDGKPDDRFKAPHDLGKVVSVVPYKKALFVLAGDVRIEKNSGQSFTFQGMSPLLWQPKAPSKSEEKK